MRKFIITKCLFLCMYVNYSQTANFSWVEQMGGSLSETAEAVTTDATGNIYITGYFDGTIDLDPGPSLAIFNSNGNHDVFIAKYSPLGNFVWAKSIGGLSSDVGMGISIDPSGNVCVVGNFGSTVDFNPNTPVFNLVSAGSSDIFVLKLTGSGNFVWAKSMGDVSADAGSSIETNSLGDVVISGNFQGTVDFDPNATVFNLTSAGLTDIYIAKLSSAGNLMWAGSAGGIGNDDANGLDLDAAGNVHCTGTFSGTSDFNPAAAVFNLTSLGLKDAFVLKWDGNGNFIWAKSIGGTGNDESVDVVVNSSNEVYYTGTYSLTVDFDPNASVFNLTASGSIDVFVSKLNAAGNFIWAKAISSTLYSSSNSLALDASGNIHAAGNFEGTVDFDPGSSVFNQSSGAGVNPNGFIFKLDPNGNFAWARTFGSTASHEYVPATTIDGSGNIYTTGSFQNGTADFDPGAGIFNLSPIGSNDIFILKLIPCAVLTSTFASANVSCHGGSNGSATITPTGGSGFTFSWTPSGGSSSIANSLSVQNYSCLISNNCGNTTTQVVPITSPPAITLTCVPSQASICSGISNTITASAAGGTGSITYTWVAGPTNSVTIVSPTSTSVYTVDVKDANNCLKTQTVSFTVNQLPTVTILASPSVVCEGKNIILAANGASSYTWQPVNLVGFLINATPSVTTTYSVVGTDVNGCVNAMPSVVQVSVNSSPTLSASSNSSLVCLGQSATLTVSGASTYTWNPGGGNGNNLVVSPATQTTYTVLGTDANGCQNTAVITQSVSACTGINFVAEVGEATVKLFPNPTSGILNIECLMLNDNTSIVIANTIGQIILKEKLYTQHSTLNIQDLPNGVYFVYLIKDNSLLKTQKLIKQ